MSTKPLVVCPSCGAINRVDLTRSVKAACGKCGKPVHPKNVMDLSQAAFDRQVMKSGIAVLVDFWSPSCGPCKMMAPQFAEAAAALYPAIRLFKVNTEAEQALAQRFDIMSVPTLVMFKDGQEIARQPGAMQKDDIVRWVQGQLLLHAHGG